MQVTRLFHLTIGDHRRPSVTDARGADVVQRRAAGRPPVTTPKSQPRRPITVYECDTCGTRAVGEQYCTECTTFMRRVGTGGTCPHCDEAVTLVELFSEDVAGSTS